MCDIDSCGICSDIFINNEFIKLKCNHKFHLECIKLSYQYTKSSICPYCRQDGGNLSSLMNCCNAIIKSGPRKGSKCNFRCKDKSIYCGKHNKSKN